MHTFPTLQCKQFLDISVHNLFSDITVHIFSRHFSAQLPPYTCYSTLNDDYFYKTQMMIIFTKLISGVLCYRLYRVNQIIFYNMPSYSASFHPHCIMSTIYKVNLHFCSSFFFIYQRVDCMLDCTGYFSNFVDLSK